MCVSATASFGVAAALVAVGALTVAMARRMGSGWLPLAVYPFAFAVQQAVEGVLWLGIEGGDADTVFFASRGFLFFSHLFWLGWVPVSVASVEPAGARRRLLQGLAVLGVAFGLTICLPSLVIADRLAVEVVQGSIEYRTRLVYDGTVAREVLRGVYAAIVIGGFLLSSRLGIRLFGALIAITLVGTLWGYPHAYISVWCFVAAISSAALIGVMLLERGETGRVAGPGRSSPAGHPGKRG